MEGIEVIATFRKRDLRVEAENFMVFLTRYSRYRNHSISGISINAVECGVSTPRASCVNFVGLIAKHRPSAASIPRTISDIDMKFDQSSGDLWVFAYGSLIW